jgi:uncharacterized membrane protein YozB (DUF420 family)
MATLSLVVELVALGLLLFGYNLKRNKNYRNHGITMTAAVVVHLILIFGWMIWSFLSFFSGPVDYANLLIITSLVHVVLGIIAATLGIYLVAAWHLQLDVQGCFARKLIMDATIATWIIAIALGIALYVAVIFS